MQTIDAPPANVLHAWRLYLEQTHGLEPARYAQVEPWAWARLLATLKAIRRKPERR